jgi:hypothetical protein
MNRMQLDPIAQILLEAHAEKISYWRIFRDDHGHPPTAQSCAHHFRSVAQGLVDLDESFDLCHDYIESGRLAYTDLATGKQYVVRSNRATAIEQHQAHGTLFDSTVYIRSKVTMLIYNFDTDGMDLSVAGTQQQQGRDRLEPSGIPTFIGTWTFTNIEQPPFDQGDGFEEGDEDQEGEG